MTKANEKIHDYESNSEPSWVPVVFSLELLDNMKIIVKTVDGKQFDVNVESSDTVWCLLSTAKRILKVFIGL